MNKKSTKNIPATSARAKLPKVSQSLILLSQAFIGAQSGLEEEFWCAKLETEVMILLDKGNIKAIDAALDELAALNQDVALNALVSSCEKMAETSFADIEGDGITRSIQLISIPITVCSPYVIHSGDIALDVVSALVNHAKQTVFAPDVEIKFLPRLYAMEHLPPDFAGLRDLMKSAAAAMINDEYLRDSSRNAIPVTELPVDNRFILGVVIAQRGAPIFRWQMASSTSVSVRREQALQTWAVATKPCFSALFSGCEIEVSLPGAFFYSARIADTVIRPYALRQAVLAAASGGVKPSTLTATIAAVGETDIAEFRIGLMQKNKDTMLNGAIWPVYGDAENAEADELQASRDISQVMAALGVKDVITISGLQHPESCDDCGAPLFFNREGEAVHVAYPEDDEHTYHGNTSQHLH